MTERKIDKKGDQRTASSEWVNLLLGDARKYQKILHNQAEQLKEEYADSTLSEIFDDMETRIISLAPMVIFDRTLQDLNIEADDEVLAGLGLVMYAISTHDDAVDERPEDRLELAGLVYGGDITTTEGMRLLSQHASKDVVDTVVHYINLTNLAQTKIVEGLWRAPTDESAYLEAINTTRYWAEVGVQAAVAHAGRPDLIEFSDEFSILYGKTCQIFDDIREIDDDLVNGYWSLPISLAHQNGLDMNTSEGRNKSILRSQEIAADFINKAEKLCGDKFPSLRELIGYLNIGFSITY